MKKQFALIVFTILMCITGCSKQDKTTDIHIIPEPVSFVLDSGTFTLHGNTTFGFVNADRQDEVIHTIINGMRNTFGIMLADNVFNTDCIKFEIDSTTDELIGNEGYRIEVTNRMISITANTSAGLFYGYQTLVQLFPADIQQKRGKDVEIPCLSIVDYPRFEWRGTHLDVCRHFFDIDFVKKYIDLLAFHKINKFHWHFTDDHGWRAEVDKYPKLTSIGAWSVDRTDVPWVEGEAPKSGEKATYGGFYTKEQMKEIVAYAKARNIDVVPEIEMPGHSSAILAAYPEMSCENDNDEDYYVQIGPYWPPVAILCAGKDEPIQMMKDVIDEMIEIFPYEYIHVGGDEAVKTNWEKCPLCQKRIKEEGLDNEEELQSWFMKQIENHIISRGRKMIGWDEILEGGLSPTSTVMSWRGEDGGIAAAQHGNEVIMTPNTYCYLDYYQADPATEPVGIGGYLPLERVYQFDPVPSMLNEEEAKLVKGGQCNLWTEFIYTPDHVEYMILPRLSAVAESVWSPKEKKDWSNFQDKISTMEKRYEAMGYNYCKGEFKPTIISTSTPDGNLSIDIKAERKNFIIHYTTDGSDPTSSSPVFTKPFTISKSSTIKAAVEIDGAMRPNIATANLVLSKLTGKDITISPAPSYKYAGKLHKTITDGELGGTSFSNGKWLGFQDNKIIFDIENNGETISKISINTFISQPNWIMGPENIVIETSEDGKNYTTAGTIELTPEKKVDGDFCKQLDFNFNKAVSPKYIRLIVNNMKELPDWHASAGGTPWVFIDEIWTE